MTAPIEHPTLIGPYKIQERLSRGGVGVVYRAIHTGNHEEVALKTIRSFVSDTITYLRREIQTLSTMQHPGIVSMIEEGIHQGLPWFAMKFIQGETLRKWCCSLQKTVKHKSSMHEDLKRILTLIARLCIPLSYVHA